MEKDLFDKMYGCWLGKNIGGTLGAPYEGCKDVLGLSFYAPVPKEPVPNDDLDLQLVWLNVLREKGVGISSRDLADVWIKNITYHCDEYGIAKANLKMGLKPPASGYYNNWFQNGMGASIRSEIWAAIAPGKPEAAAYYAYQDACVDHYGEGIYGEIFLAALESAAFFNDDLLQSIDTGLSFLPESSRVYQVVNFVRKLYAGNVSLLEGRQAILDEFGSFNVSDCVQNIGFVILGLLYGKGDFGLSVLSTVNCGYDTDCTAATAGAIMGILLGGKKIPAKWIVPIGEKIMVDSRIVGISVPKNLTQLTKQLLLISEKIDRDGLQVLPRPFSLPEAKLPSSSPFSFPFLVNGEKSITFPDFHFDLNRYLKKIPGIVKLSTFLYNPSARKVRILPACNDGVKLWLDGGLVLSHHDHKPIRPAPHFPESSRFVDLSLSKGWHKVDMEIWSCRKPLEFSWVVSEWDKYRLFPLLTDLKYSSKKRK